jgi:hypothetical protein
VLLRFVPSRPEKPVNSTVCSTPGMPDQLDIFWRTSSALQGGSVEPGQADEVTLVLQRDEPDRNVLNPKPVRNNNPGTPAGLPRRAQRAPTAQLYAFVAAKALVEQAENQPTATGQARG